MRIDWFIFQIPFQFLYDFLINVLRVAKIYQWMTEAGMLGLLGVLKEWRMHSKLGALETLEPLSPSGFGTGSAEGDLPPLSWKSSSLKAIAEGSE